MIPRWLQRPQAQAWLGLGTGVVLLSILAGVHTWQERTYDRHRDAVERIRQARMDLAQGYAHVVSAEGPDEYFDRDQGLALLSQATRELSEADLPAGAAPAGQALSQSAAAMLDRLAHGTAMPEDADRARIELRLATARLAADAAVVDAAVRQDLRALEVVHRRVFRWTLALVASVITGAAGLLYLSRRAAMQAEAAQAQAERERSQSQAREREAARLLRAVADGVSEAVFVKDREGRYLFINRFGLTFVGRTLDEVIGQTDDLLFGTESAEALRALDARVMAERVELVQEAEVSSRGGTRTYLTTRAPLFDDAGQVVGTVGIATNITERKAMERALRVELDRLAHLAACAPGVLFSYRHAPDGRDHFIYVSPQFEQLLGLPPAALEADAMPLFALLSTEAMESLRATRDASARDLQPLRVEHMVQHPSRGEVWIEIHAAPSREPDGALVWHGFLADVSARHALEEALRQAQKMEAIGRLAGGIAHDFNNLLMVINAWAGMLRAGEVRDPAGVEEASSAIFDAGERAAALTAQLLAFSRKAIIAPTNLDLGQRVQDSERLLRRLIGEDLHLETTLAPHLPRVRIDPTRLDQVIVNLVVNARDAMPSGGTLRLSTREVHLEQEGTATTGPYPPGHYVELSVQDTGVGMTAAVRAHLFEPFFTTKGQGRGTGLGLAVVHGILAQAGGHALVESTPDTGTTVRVRLPAVQGQETPKPEDPRRAPGGTERVLVVEDEHAVRRLVVQGLRGLGYTVLSAVDAEHALAMLQAGERFDALITDIVLPGRSGADLAESARQALPSLRVVLMTGYSDDEVRRRGANRPTAALLRKPFQIPELARALRAVLDASPDPAPPAG